VRRGPIVPPDVGVLFLTKEGLDFTPDHLSGMVSRYVERADIGKRGKSRNVAGYTSGRAS
jgi:hypothetical protein